MTTTDALSDEAIDTLLEYQNRGVRNVEAFMRSQVTRRRIRTLLEKHPPLSPPLTAKAILARLPDLTLCVRAVQWHMKAIRAGR